MESFKMLADKHKTETEQLPSKMSICMSAYKYKNA